MANMGVGVAWGRFALNALFSKNPAWVFEPEGDLKAIRKGGYVEVSSRTELGKTYIVDLRGGTCIARASGTTVGAGIWRLRGWWLRWLGLLP